MIVIGVQLASAASPGETSLLSRPTGTATLPSGNTNDSFARGGFIARGGEGVSANGELIVLASDSNSLSTDDVDGFRNVFVRDTVDDGDPTDGQTILVSRETGAAGAALQGDSVNPVISPDGTKVAFQTTANITGVDANSTDDIYVRDLLASTTTLVSRASGTGTATSSSSRAEHPSISADGNEVAFETFRNLGSDPSNQDVYVRNLTDPVNPTTTRASVADDESAANSNSFQPSISDDGNRVAFQSNASNLNASDGNGGLDIHVRDLGAGTTILASRATDVGGTPGEVGNSQSSLPAISGDGNRVAFESIATNLIGSGNDTNGSGDVFVRDTGAASGLQTTTRVSVTGDGSEAAGVSFGAAISTDGNEVAFLCNANLDGGGTNTNDAYVRDLDGGGSTALASRQSAGDGGAPADADVNDVSISGDGTVASFDSLADNLSADDANDFRQVFRRDLAADTTALVSRPSGAPVPPDGTNHSQIASSRAVSRDGRYVAFLSLTDDLAPGQVNGVRNAFVRDTRTDTTTLVSRETGPGGAGANADTLAVSVSADGTSVAFETDAVLDGTADTNGRTDIYVRDMDANTTELVSRASGESGAVATGLGSFNPAISADGTRVAFDTRAPNLGGGASNAVHDVFVRDLGTDETIHASKTVAQGDPTGGDSQRAALDADGSTVAFDSAATNLIGAGNDTNNRHDVFLRDLETSDTSLLSRASDDGINPGVIGNETSLRPAISADGRRIAFESSAGNLDPATAGTSISSNVYLRDRSANPATTTLVSRLDGDGTFPLGGSSHPSISADGEKIAFQSPTTVDGTDPNGTWDIFVRDRSVGPETTTLVSRASDSGGVPGAVGNRGSEFPSISLDGNCVAFHSSSSNLSPDYAGTEFTQVFLRVISGECPDVTPPSVAIGSGPPDGSTTNEPSPEFGFTASPDATTVECRFDGGSFGPCDSATTDTPAAPLDDGQHSFEVRAADANGNSDAEGRTFTVDATGPLTEITGGPPKRTRDRTPTFRFDAPSEPPGTVTFKCRLDGQAYTACTSPQRYGRQSPGRHKFRVQGTDAFGNAGPVALRRFRIIRG